MKKLIAIAFFAVTISANAQTHLDTLIFNKVNEYRAKKGIKPLFWSDQGYRVAKNQAQYIKLLKAVIHDQIDSVSPTFKLEPNFVKRFSRQGICVTDTNSYEAENLVAVGDTVAFVSDEEVANRAINSWKNSPAHNSMMLMKEVTFAGVANVIGSELYDVAGIDPATLEETIIQVKGYVYFIALDAHN